MLGEYRHGALTVVQQVNDADWINRRLRTLSPKLFVEKQLGFDDREVWCVVEDTGEQRGPDRYLTVLEFRGPDGEPIPYLNEQIVHEMEQRAKDGTGNMKAAQAIVAKRNRDRIEQHRRETDQHYEDIARDFEEHRRIGSFTIVPRSRQLAQTRARVRAQRHDELRAFASALEIARALDRHRMKATLRS